MLQICDRLRSRFDDYCAWIDGLSFWRFMQYNYVLAILLFAATQLLPGAVSDTTYSFRTMADCPAGTSRLYTKPDPTCVPDHTIVTSSSPSSKDTMLNDLPADQPVQSNPKANSSPARPNVSPVRPPSPSTSHGTAKVPSKPSR